MKQPVIDLDRVSMIVTCPANLRLKKLEERLRTEGLSLGFAAPSGKKFTVREILEKNGSLLGEVCMAVRVRSRYGEIQTKKVPRAATGPDFKKIFLGSHGRYGRIEAATFRVTPIPFKRELKGDKRLIQRIREGGLEPVRVVLRRGRIKIELAGRREVVLAKERVLKKWLKERR